MPLFEGNVGLAVGISVGAGLSTLFGAVVLFLPQDFRERHAVLLCFISFPSEEVQFHLQWFVCMYVCVLCAVPC